MSELIKSLGFRNKRTADIIKFSTEYITKDWKSPRELHGIGQYAQDSWDLFIELKRVRNPSDHKLSAYVKWQRKIGFFKVKSF